VTTPLTHKPAVIPQDAEEITRGAWQWDVSAGARVIAIGVQADAAKDSMMWWDAQRATMPPYEFLREYGLDFGALSGKPVFPEYQDRFHAATAPLAYQPNRPLVRGWDIPGPVGVAWLQRVALKPLGRVGVEYDGLVRIHVLAEFLSDGSIEAAGAAVQAITREQFPGVTDLVDFADPAAFDRKANDTQSCADILRRACGIHLRPGPRTITERHEPMRRALMAMNPNAAPTEPPGALLIDPACGRIKDALRSAYHYKPLPGPQSRYHDLPEKNWASHLADGLCYGLARLDEASLTAADVAKPSQPPLDYAHALGAYPSHRWR
jgi:hypothetical protein